MKKVISSAKVGIKGYETQSFKSSNKKVKGGKSKKTVSKLTMPVAFKKGTKNPVKSKQVTNGYDMLLKACKSYK